MATRQKATQHAMHYGKRPGWGGCRPNSGRPKVSEESVPHARRPEHDKRHPVHMTWHLGHGLPKMKNKRTLARLRQCFRDGGDKRGFRLTHFSVQGNHLHLIVECDSRKHLANGMKAIQIRIARGVNRLWERRGRVFRDRYHDHVCKTPSEVRRALCYVLNNYYKHGYRATLGLDCYASGAWFGGWRQSFTVTGAEGMGAALVSAA